MRYRPTIQPPFRAFAFALLGCMAAATGCDTHNPTGVDGKAPRSLRADTYGPPVVVANFEYQARCGTFNLIPQSCAPQGDSLVVVLPPGRHRLTARVSGWIQLEGISGPAAHCRRYGPLGYKYDFNLGYFLRTEVFWTLADRSAFVPLAIVGGDSSVAEGTVDVPEGGAVYIRRGDGGYVGYCHMVSPPPTVEITAQQIFDEQATVVLSCQGDLGPGRVTRDSTVRCEARKEPSSAPDSLQILGWSFENRPRTDGDVHSPLWTGRMAREGRVSLRAAIGSQQPVTKTVKIEVEDRVWPELVVRSVTRAIHVDLYSMKNYPPSGDAYGRHELGYLDFDHMQFRHPETGPNAGLFYLSAPAQILPSTIHLHPALYLPNSLPSNLDSLSAGYSDWKAWYDDQNGHGSGSCGPGQVAVLRANVERHEGVTLATDSHVGVANRSFIENKFQRRLERVVSESDSTDVKYRLSVVFQRLTDAGSAYHQRQVAFDTKDTPTVFALGCTLDSNRHDN
jgi:hypothetical protein